MTTEITTDTIFKTVLKYFIQDEKTNLLYYKSVGGLPSWHNDPDEASAFDSSGEAWEYIQRGKQIDDRFDGKEIDVVKLKCR